LQPVFELVAAACRRHAAFDRLTPLFLPPSKKGHPNGVAFCLAKDCYFNKMRVIVNFRNRETLLLF